MKRLALTVVVVLGLGAAPGASVVAAEAAAPPAAAADSLQSDFNNDGFADLAIGVPGESVLGAAEAGAVNVLYGGAAGLTGSGSRLFTQNSPGVGGSAEMGDLFGSELATGDFNNDGFADLAIGVLHESVGSLDFAGAVHVLYGGSGGLTGSGSQFFTQNSPGVGSAAEPFDRFGGALTAGDFDNDGFTDLAVGVPHEGVGSVEAPGAVNVLYGTTTGLTGSGSQTFTQNNAGVGSSREHDDFFGSALAAADYDNDGFADLAIGAPGESSSLFAVGAVNVLYGTPTGLTGSGSQFFTQNSPGVANTAEELDQFGVALAAGDLDADGFADLAVDVPESIGTIIHAGAVHVLYGTAAGLTGSGSQFFTQNSPGVGSAAEPYDYFGSVLAAGDLNNDGLAELAIGVPDESSSLRSVGAVHVLYGTLTGLTGSGSQFFTQNSPGVGSTAESYDYFGGGLAAGDFNDNGFADLAIGVFGESIGTIDSAGAVNVLYGTPAGLTGTGSRYLNQNTPEVAETAGEDDRFGAPLAAAGGP